MTNAAASNEEFTGRFVLTSAREEIERAEKSLLLAIEQKQYDRSSLFAIRLALEEALTNAFKHGNKGDPSKTVRLHCDIQVDAVTIDVIDEGSGFDPDAVPDPTESENLEIPSGRGLTLMRAYMTEVQILPPGNRVKMKYVRPTE
jgi:serine/threonine-protein kinase RsbW